VYAFIVSWKGQLTGYDRIEDLPKNFWEKSKAPKNKSLNKCTTTASAVEKLFHV
jgi:hypothetical protein